MISQLQYSESSCGVSPSSLNCKVMASLEAFHAFQSDLDLHDRITPVHFEGNFGGILDRGGRFEIAGTTSLRSSPDPFVSFPNLCTAPPTHQCATLSSTPSAFSSTS